MIFIPLRQENSQRRKTHNMKNSSKPTLCTIGVGRRQSHIGSKRGKSPLRNFQLLLLSSSSPSIGNILFKLSVFLFSRPVGIFLNQVGTSVSGGHNIVYDRNHYFGLGPILIPKPKLANTFGRYCNRYRNHISKGKSSYL